MSTPTTVAELHDEMMIRIKLMSIAARAMLRELERSVGTIDELSARVGKLEVQVGKLVAAQ